MQYSVVDITEARALPEHRLQLVFANGVEGEVDLSGEEWVGVLEPLANQAYFEQVRVVDGTVAWPNGVDMAPDVLYEEVLSTSHA